MHYIGSPEAYGMRRYDGLYFEDGNIILVAEGVCFRVHASQLTRHSEVFKGMIDIPQPVNPFMIDGCSVAILHDKMEDVSHLLKAIYDGLYISEGTVIEFSSLSAILRISTKYFFECTRRRALARLRQDWPRTLADWDAREKRAMTSEGLDNYSVTTTNPILIVNLARELSLPSFLPAAFYDLSRHTPAQILGGSPETSDCPKQRLNEVDLMRVFKGKEAGQEFICSFIATELEDRGTAPWCRNSNDNHNEICREAFRLIMLETLKGIRGLTAGRERDPLFTLQCIKEMQARQTPFDIAEKITAKGCEACRAELRIATERARQKFWDHIPEWFCLEEIAGEEEC